MLNPRDQELLEGLNPEQAAAVSAGPGPLLVLAGAGSGKTRVLTRRMAWLVAHGTAEEALVALTFTNKAAGEMKERVANLLGSRRPRSFVGTFHSFGVRLLRRFAPEAGLTAGFVVFDADDQLAVFRHALKAAGITDKTLTPKAVASKISRARNAGWSREEYPRRFGDFVGTRLAELHTAYEKELKKANAVDFDDLLAKSAKLLSGNADVLGLLQRSVTQLLVDEYQDTNGAQALIVKLLAGKAQNVFAVGDEDQSIYRWRGADVSNILEFERDFPGAKTIRLERNYRSTAPILEAAGAVVAENRRRLGKTLKATKTGGEPVTLLVLPEERDEAREVVERISRLRAVNPGAEVAVLFRTNAQSRPFEDELVRARLPYLLVGGTRFYERQEVKDALAYLRLLGNPDDDVSFRRVVNVPARGIGTTTLEGLSAAATTRGGSLFAVLSSLPEGLTERAKKALVEFRDLVTSLRETFAKEETGAGTAVAAVLTGTGLLALYEDSDDPQDQARRENLDQLLAAARDHERTGSEDEGDTSLAGFLDAVTLRSDADDVDARKGIVLMTLHAAKGLEFDEVFFAGMENGSLPHASSRDDDDELEEERRLAYVGMTRAKEKLTLSRVLRRMVHGEWMSREPSPFLDAIPARALVVVDRTFGGGGRETRFGASERGGGLFPDYEGESQESFEPPRAAARPVARPQRPAVPPMRRTPPPPTASGFRRGARVRHPEYGVGVILLVEGSGDQEKLTVYFDRAGRRKFVARYSQLTQA
ncbi:MAG: UvrD-helicase domain-containing protein [Holophagales bacterium]|nr:UvrD-helicase domain-containing protein [Holophagales bacterium]